MNALTRVAVAGIFGSLTTNVLHELARRVRPDAPRVDLLGIQAFSKILALLKVAPPRGRTLYVATFAADVASNSIYFSLAGIASRTWSIASGLLIGAVAGTGAVILPTYLELDPKPTNRTWVTQTTTVALYAAGGLVTGYALHALGPSHDTPINDVEDR